MSKNVAMFVDVANMYYAARGQDVDVDYVALLKHATKGRDLIRAYAYTGLDPENENQRKFIDFLQEENTPSPYEALANQKWSEEVRRLLTTLTPIESSIIRWRFGLDDEDELTLKEIGDKYNLSRERIRQLQEQALGKIRKHMRDNWS